MDTPYLSIHLFIDEHVDYFHICQKREMMWGLEIKEQIKYAKRLRDGETLPKLSVEVLPRTGDSAENLEANILVTMIIH